MLLSLSRAQEAKRKMCSWCFWILVMVQCCRSRRSCCPSVTFCRYEEEVSGGKWGRIPPHSRMTTAASRGCVPVPGPYPQVYLGIIDQHSASLVQFLHDLQNGHLNIHLYTLLHVGHLANPSGEGGPHQVCSGRCSPGDTPMALESTYELRTSLVFFCSVACLSPRRFTSEAKSLRWFLTASSKNWYLRADRDRSGH